MHSTAVWVGRAKQAKVGVGGETARVFIFLAASPLSGAPVQTAMLRRLPTFRDVTKGSPAAQVTSNRSQVKVRVQVSLLALITVLA